MKKSQIDNLNMNSPASIYKRTKNSLMYALAKISVMNVKQYHNPRWVIFAVPYPLKKLLDQFDSQKNIFTCTSRIANDDEIDDLIILYRRIVARASAKCRYNISG